MGMRRNPERCISCGEATTFTPGLIRASQYYCTPCKSAKVLKTRRKKAANYNAYQRNYYDIARRKILEHYGGNPPKCACCGEAQYFFLTLDHMNVTDISIDAK